jgi:hypothetical protein
MPKACRRKIERTLQAKNPLKLNEPMYPNLLEAPSGAKLHIVLIDSKKLSAMLGQMGIGVDTEIVKIEPRDGGSSDTFICSSAHPSKLKIPSHQARQLYVRICEICWSCGECRTPQL